MARMVFKPGTLNEELNGVGIKGKNSSCWNSLCFLPFFPVDIIKRMSKKIFFLPLHYFPSQTQISFRKKVPSELLITRAVSPGQSWQMCQAFVPQPIIISFADEVTAIWKNFSETKSTTFPLAPLIKIATFCMSINSLKAVEKWRADCCLRTYYIQKQCSSALAVISVLKVWPRGWLQSQKSETFFLHLVIEFIYKWSKDSKLSLASLTSVKCDTFTEL